MTTLDVALCQYELGTADEMDELIAACRGLLDRAGPADVFVLPELHCNDLRLRGEETQTAAVALSPAEVDSYHDFVRAAAADREALVVGGSYTVAVDDAFRNRMPVATPDELLTYDKCHPTPPEREGGTVAGDEDPPLVAIRGVDVGVLNCYDVEFPAAVRAVVDRGAELLVNPSFTPSPHGAERVRRCGAARAVENQCYLASVPIVGRRGDVVCEGRSTVFAPCDDVLGHHGTRLQLPRNEAAAATCTVDVDTLRTARREAEVRPYTDYREVF